MFRYLQGDDFPLGSDFPFNGNGDVHCYLAALDLADFAAQFDWRAKGVGLMYLTVSVPVRKRIGGKLSIGRPSAL